jgi:Rrf2 family protein
MRITQETDYAFRILAHLARAGKGVKVDAKTIGESEGVTLRFTLKILRKLGQAKMVVSFRGVNGGYALNDSPENINMKTVIEAIEGPVFINRCLYDENYCNVGRSKECILHKAFEKIQKNLLDDFEKVTLRDVIDNNLKL